MLLLRNILYSRIFRSFKDWVIMQHYIERYREGENVQEVAHGPSCGVVWIILIRSLYNNFHTKEFPFQYEKMSKELPLY